MWSLNKMCITMDVIVHKSIYVQTILTTPIFLDWIEKDNSTWLKQRRPGRKWILMFRFIWGTYFKIRVWNALRSVSIILSIPEVRFGITWSSQLKRRGEIKGSWTKVGRVFSQKGQKKHSFYPLQAKKNYWSFVQLQTTCLWGWRDSCLWPHSEKVLKIQELTLLASSKKGTRYWRWQEKASCLCWKDEKDQRRLVEARH